MHVTWKTSHILEWQGLQIEKSGMPTIVLNAFADYNLWLWHYLFGWPGSLHDILVGVIGSCLNCFVLHGSFTSCNLLVPLLGSDK